MVKKKNIIKLLIVASLFYMCAWIVNAVADVKEENYQINGTIQKITYSVKGTPKVTVNSEMHALSTSWRFNEKMAVGDSLIKEQNTMTYKLIKHETGEVFFSQ
jgi:PBP1b-binding outer membrane lipoprotein LpoB